MDVSAPHRSVVAGLDGDVLVLLAGRTAPMTGREIADALGLRSHDGVRKSLERLVAQGIVDRQPAGNALMHRLNREHVAAPVVLALASLRTELWTRLRDAIAAWPVQPAHASVFGSAARGDGGLGSDVDLFVLRPDRVDPDDLQWQDQLARLEELVHDWTGNAVSIVEQSEGEVRELAHAAGRHPTLDNVSRDAIDLAGRPARALLKEA
jgi:predicted nucleotidyltransferase